jgi:hypothetical protein
MVRAPHLDLHIGAVRIAHSTFISEFFTNSHKLEVTLKLWDNTMEIGQIPAGETGV